MEDSIFEFYDRNGFGEGFGAFVWLCIGIATMVIIGLGTVIYALC